MHDIIRQFSLPSGPTSPRQRPDIAIPGSPERCLERTVWEDGEHSLWLLEKLAPAQCGRRETIGRVVSDLAQAGAPYVHAFRPCADGGYVLTHAGTFWQCSPFLEGTELPRPDYIRDAWRGEHIGNLIAGLQQAGDTLSALPEADTPPLPAYVAGLVDTIRRREPGVHARLAPMLPSFGPLFTVLDTLPTAMAHGDCHPLNIIWTPDGIAGLIDWEFAGRKPVLYDAANCIGCVGFEHPDWLVNGLVPQLVTTLHASRILTEEVLPWLVPFTCALRFAWLSEWLRRDDREMIEMELDYMEIFMRHGNDIQDAWQRVCA